MAVRKPTTTADLTSNADVAPPTFEDQIAAVGDLTDAAMLAKVNSLKTIKVTSPAGVVTEVPQDILQALKDSGYKTGK